MWEILIAFMNFVLNQALSRLPLYVDHGMVSAAEGLSDNAAVLVYTFLSQIFSVELVFSLLFLMLTMETVYWAFSLYRLIKELIPFL